VHKLSHQSRAGKQGHPRDRLLHLPGKRDSRLWRTRHKWESYRPQDAAQEFDSIARAITESAPLAIKSRACPADLTHLDSYSFHDPQAGDSKQFGRQERRGMCRIRGSLILPTSDHARRRNAMLEARVSACSELIRRQGSGRLSRFFATYTMPSFLAFDRQRQFL
jgi:hypothetical protein